MDRRAFINRLILRAGIMAILLNVLPVLNAAEAAPLPDVDSAENQGSILELNEENDFFAGADRHYTQGARLAYLGADKRANSLDHGFIKLIPTLGFHMDVYRTGLELGQSLYTPQDLSTEESIPNDHPYAGWLYGGGILQRQGSTRHLNVPVLETMRIQAGIVGPGAMAEQMQDIVHITARFTKPHGWQNQIHNEPGLAVKYQRAWRVSSREQRGWGVDLIPHAGASLGNVDTSLRAGATLRIGRQLPDDFGIQTIDSLGITDGGRRSSSTDDHTWGFYGFVGTEGKAVAYTMFLDGNLFEAGPSVDKRPLVAELKSGLVLVFASAELAFMYVVRSEEFYGQQSADIFGSLFLKWKFGT